MPYPIFDEQYLFVSIGAMRSFIRLRLHIGNKKSILVVYVILRARSFNIVVVLFIYILAVCHTSGQRTTEPGDGSGRIVLATTDEAVAYHRKGSL